MQEYDYEIMGVRELDEIHVIMSERESEGACSLLTNGEIIG